MIKFRRVHESELCKTRKQEARMKRMEGLLDTINNLGVEDICVAKSFLNYVQAASRDAERSINRAEVSESPQDLRIAQNDVDHFCDVAQKAIDGLLALKIVG